MKTFKDFRKYLQEEEDTSDGNFTDGETISLDAAISGDFDGSYDGDQCCEYKGEHAHNSIKVQNQKIQRNVKPQNIHIKFLDAKNFNKFKTIKNTNRKFNQKRKKNK